ncbi:hypothetical protein [Flavobacterium sp. UBA6135]|uniref:hypothetical protein n=1 Tax=Flavobacterium sp. UBA6135 TaxID=1946553 RepID=UPI0025BFF311|nr:hypothetical protein [Flavobacterium sp. UBA6135]
MKLLIITAVQEFGLEVKKQLKENGVQTYSYREVTGFRDSTMDAVETNWFATEMNETTSLLFFAFVTEQQTESILLELNRFNLTCEVHSKIHASIVPIEKTTN